jgi:DNA-binding response OmpR family regulator
MVKNHILVVEDYKPLLVGIRDILETEGYTVFTATDGEQALQIIDEACPNLILADIMMPTMDGYALYEAIRARPEWASVPFVFLTSKAQEKDLSRGKELGVDSYITKPFDPDQLLATVQTLLEHGRAT